MSTTDKPDFVVPSGATAALVLANGTVFWGTGIGAITQEADAAGVGELCFNTSLTGYQEIMTDPSYAGQIICFTFPHIGNVGTNPQDLESVTPFAKGLVVRADVTEPSNWRSAQHLDAWLKSQNISGIAGLDTRALTRTIRELNAPSAMIVHNDNPEALAKVLKTAWETLSAWPGLAGMDLASQVSTLQTYSWDQTRWSPISDSNPEAGYGKQNNPKYKVVAVDYGAKHNILRCLASAGCDITVVPANTSAEDILGHKPDGVFLSNGPGDPEATGSYAVEIVQGLLESGKPIFGICLGHQILARALGAKTHKMDQGHRGGNHPVQDLATKKVEITSQNHGFCVDESSLPDTVEITHRSLFDGTNEGIRSTQYPAFSVQYHPEASPGPEDSLYLFKRFTDLIDQHQNA